MTIHIIASSTFPLNYYFFYYIPSFLISRANGMNHLSHMGVLYGTTLMKKMSIFRKWLGHMGVLHGTTLIKKMRKMVRSHVAMVLQNIYCTFIVVNL